VYVCVCVVIGICVGVSVCVCVGFVCAREYGVNVVCECGLCGV